MKTNLKPIAIAVAGAVALAGQAFAADTINVSKVEVVSTTPLQGIGITLDKVPANIQLVKDEEFKKQKSTTIADFMTDNLQGVAVNDTQNNPFQPDILFRGFSASPLLGTPQGMSIYVDGVRVNEPFGDAVNWDLIPMNAIAGMQLVPGTNPVYGLNTLGGAISVQTKSGRTHQGIGAEVSAGSWGRKTASAEVGGVSKDGSVDYFFSVNSFRENGWRDHSDTDVRQIFAKTGWQNETSKIDLSFTGADNDMIGNGLVQNEIISGFGRDAIHTKPDQTKNTMSFLNLSGAHWFNNDVMFSGNTYYRHSKRKTLNGDINDGFDSAAYNLLGDCGSNNTYEEDETCSGVLNRSQTKQDSYGLNGQLVFNQDLMGKKNQFTVGAAYDISKIKFKQSEEVGEINASRGVDGEGVVEETTNLHGKTKTWSLFGTNTLSLNDFWHLTASGRYNHVKVENRDQIITDATDPATLTGNHTFNRVNPAVGLNFTPTKDLTIYGSYNEGNRAPTSMELGCANPAYPCLLPNAMAGDPPLKQVVVKTYEAGVRGNLTDEVRWTAAVYRSENHNDIHFIHSSDSNNTSMGYFDNVGKTRRVGLDLGLLGNYGKFSWNTGYSFVNATYQSDLELTNEVNSTVSPDGTIAVQKGDRLANIPRHQFKLRMQYAVTPDWYVGSNVIAFSDRYMRGNENNNHQANDGDGDHYQGSGKIAGYAIVNLDTRYNIGSGWSVFGKAINVFDRKYYNAGMLGETHFGSDGVFNSSQDPTAYLAPGAPRAGWVGVRYDFAAPKAAQ
jgi:outer membrane receptor protein involved in Fe transport